MGRYILHNGLGMFLSTTGIIFLVLGIIIFIFFLSIDPGYGWTKTIDLSKNYIMIFASMAIGITGVVLIVIGQQINEMYMQTLNEAKRCRQLLSGNAEEVLKQDWYTLCDQMNEDFFEVYLFQKKSNRNNYKIAVIKKSMESARTVKNLIITSELIPQLIMVNNDDSACSGVLEKDISINFKRNQQHNGNVRFDLLLTITDEATITPSEREKKIQFSLKNEISAATHNQENFTAKNTNTDRGSLPLECTSLLTRQLTCHARGVEDRWIYLT